MLPIIGTSGYSYEDWKGVFYPQDIPRGKMLDFYAKQFKAVEINSTYYKIPHPAVFYQMDIKTPDNFKFIVKTNRESTHIRKKNTAAMKTIKESVKPIVESGKFSGFLAQFPYSFKNVPQNREYLHEIKIFAEEYPLFVEFRNHTWNNEDTFDFLTKNEIFYVNVDQPRLKGLIPPQNYATGNLGYLRFHGKNSKNWWNGTNQSRYDYLYNNSELEQWLIRIAHLMKKTYKTYIFFNNHPQGKAVQNAQMLQSLLDQKLKSLNM